MADISKINPDGGPGVYDIKDAVAREKLTVVDPTAGSGMITFGVDANGNYGYKKVGADTVIPFKNIDDSYYYTSSYDVYGMNYIEVSSVGVESRNFYFNIPIKNSIAYENYIDIDKLLELGITTLRFVFLYAGYYTVAQLNNYGHTAKVNLTYATKGETNTNTITRSNGFTKYNTTALIMNNLGKSIINIDITNLQGCYIKSIQGVVSISSSSTISGNLYVGVIMSI